MTLGMTIDISFKAYPFLLRLVQDVILPLPPYRTIILSRAG